MLINPEIVKIEGKQAGEEGCLSIPGFREQVTRGEAGHGARAERQGRIVRDDRRRPAGARLPARDRSPERHAYISHISALKRDLIKRKIRSCKEPASGS